jgi:hypothetical protein
VVDAWPVGHPDEATSGEARLLLALASFGDRAGVVTVPRSEIARSAQLDGHEVGAGLSWARWRDVIASARRISEPGAARVDRIQLRRWPDS